MNVSVALATHNGAQFLRDQLNSLQAQTVRPFELVAVDDGSTDETLEILDDYGAVVPFPVVVSANPKHLGYAETFWRAAKMCRGDFIAFCDQDDVWLESKIARCVELLRKSGALLLVHQNIVVTADLVATGRRVPAFKSSRTAAPLRVEPWALMPGNAMVFSRTLLDFDFSRRPAGLLKSGGPMTHDEWTYFLATAIGITQFSTDVLTCYRQHGGNVFGAPSGPSLAQSLTPAPEEYRFLAELAIERSAFFEELSATARSGAAVYQRAATYYRSLAGRQAARAHVYSRGAGTVRRLGRVAHLAATGGYRSRSRGGLGRRSFLKDTVAGIAYRPDSLRAR
jgi:hypothetical protein